MFSISFRKYRDEEKEKQLVYFDPSKCKFSLFAPSLRQQLVLVLRFYGVIETRFLNQSACVFALGYFLTVLNIQKQ